MFLSKFCRCVSCIQQDGRTNGIVGIYHALHVELREQRSYEEEQKMSAVLCESIQESIRKGDFYTKYNSRQYLVMLIEIEQESCQKVSKRINKQFMSKMGQKRSLKVNYYVASVGEVCQNTEKKSDIFE